MSSAPPAAQPRGQFDFLALISPKIAERANGAAELEALYPEAAGVECRWVIEQLLRIYSEVHAERAVAEQTGTPARSHAAAATDRLRSELTVSLTTGEAERIPKEQRPGQLINAGVKAKWLDRRLGQRLRRAREAGNAGAHHLLSARRRAVRAALDATWELAAIAGRELTDLPESFDHKRQDQLNKQMRRERMPEAPGARLSGPDVERIKALIGDLPPDQATAEILVLLDAAEGRQTTAQRAATSVALTAAWSTGQPSTADSTAARDWLIADLLQEASWVDSATANGTGGTSVDHVLRDGDGVPAAILETTHSSESLPAGLTYADRVADEIEQQHGRRPVVYASNGFTHERLVPYLPGMAVEALDPLDVVLSLLEAAR